MNNWTWPQGLLECELKNSGPKLIPREYFTPSSHGRILEDVMGLTPPGCLVGAAGAKKKELAVIPELLGV